MTPTEKIQALRTPTPKQPLRVLFSACLTGLLVGYDGSSCGTHPHLLRYLQSPRLKAVRFCPEDYAFGTPRGLCDIHGGNGFDVLEGKARVLTAEGEDWTLGLVRASQRMLEFARKQEVELAILLDISAACGSQVIYNGGRLDENPTYQKGPGVAAAQLMRGGIPVISQRDFRALEALYAKLDPAYSPAPSAIDHHETEWYRNYFS